MEPSMTEPTTTDLLKAILGLGQRMEDRFTKIEAGQAELKADVSDLKADVARLDAKIDVVEARLHGDIQQVRHEASSAYFRAIGRTDQVASSLAEHVVVGHKSAAE